MRDINPNDEINFIYDSHLLSPAALEELKSFCVKYNIVPRDVQTDVIPLCQTVEEKALIELYRDEISHLAEGGNLAVGSDLLRWLQPVYALGTYTDFDVHVDTRSLPETISVEKPLLISLGSYTIEGEVEGLLINNDTIAVVDSQAALVDIKKIQNTIYARCSRQPSSETHSNFIEHFMSYFKMRLRQECSPITVDVYLDLMKSSNELPILAELIRGKTVREMRKDIRDTTADNVLFSKSILKESRPHWMPDSTLFDDSSLITKAASLRRAEIKQGLGPIGWLLLSKSQYKQLEALSSIQDDDEFLDRLRTQTRMMRLKNSVVYTTGPMALMSALFRELLYEKDTVNNDIALFSFSHYGLDNVFISENSFPLHASKKMVTAKMQSTEIGKFNDLSWLQEGQNAMAIREQKIRDAQLHMPQDFHDMRERITARIKKIQGELEGPFGFYRNKDRHAKIDALQCILGYFQEGHFDLDGYNSALENYRTKEVSASIGESKTKKLIDDLEHFGQTAKHYMLTDENGKIEILPPTPLKTVGQEGVALSPQKSAPLTLEVATAPVDRFAHFRQQEITELTEGESPRSTP